MKRKVTAFLILLIVTFTSLNEARAEVNTFSCNGGQYSVEMPSGVLTKASGCKGNLTIDSSVKSIGQRAFASSEITSLIIPDSVTKIGDGAFYFSNISTVIIPNSITKIEGDTFKFSEISSIIIPDSVTEIGNAAFSQTFQLTSIKLGKSLTTIGDRAFWGTGLSGINLPESLKTIGGYAFWMEKYVYLDIPNSVTTIGNKAFEDMKNLKSIFYCGSVTTGFPTSPTCPVDRKAAVAAIEAKIAAEAKVAQDAAKVAAKVAADKAAADRAAAEIKAAADRAATQAAQDAKKLTITCKKGSASKKITGESPVCPKGFTNSLDKYLTFQAYSKCKLYKKNSPIAGVSLLDNGQTLKFSYTGKYSSFMASAVSYADVSCTLSVMKAPSFVTAQIDTTRALDGLQRATWGKNSSFWTYHPDDGLNISFNSN